MSLLRTSLRSPLLRQPLSRNASTSAQDAAAKAKDAAAKAQAAAGPAIEKAKAVVGSAADRAAGLLGGQSFLAVFSQPLADALRLAAYREPIVGNVRWRFCC